VAITERRRLAFTAIAVSLVGIVTGLLLGGALLPSTATTPAPAPGSVEVYVKNAAFYAATSPDSWQPNITVPVGTTVIWTNLDLATHTVTSLQDLFDSGGLSPFSYTFTEPGVYSYRFMIHPQMRGTVTAL
jgi:plastocyanin